MSQPVGKPPQNDQLADQSHWESFWTADQTAFAGQQESDKQRRRRFGILRELSRDYGDYALWDVLYPTFLSDRPGASVVEIGSAPGTFLVRLARRFSLQPYGIEYTPTGAAQNRQIFEQNGFEASRVIEGDFFSPDLAVRYREAFDIVISRGFIEHFTDVSDVVGRHVALLKKGGRLIVAIPRFRGVYGAWMKVFDAEDLARHNLDIMEGDAFARAFEGHGLASRYCGPYGAVAWRRFFPQGEARLPRLARKALTGAIMPANAMMRLAVRGYGLKNRWLSPHLIYVGDKVT